MGIAPADVGVLRGVHGEEAAGGTVVVTGARSCGQLVDFFEATDRCLALIFGGGRCLECALGLEIRVRLRCQSGNESCLFNCNSGNLTEGQWSDEGQMGRGKGRHGESRSAQRTRPCCLFWG